MQGRGESNVSPEQLKHGWAPSRAQIWCKGPSQIGWAPDFVMSKTDGENAAVWSQIWCDLQKKEKDLHWNFDCFSGRNQVISKKKGFHRNFDCFSGQNQVISKKKKRSSPKFRLLGLPLRFRWPFYYSMQFGWAPTRAHGPPKHHGPRGHCPPCPPLRDPGCT